MAYEAGQSDKRCVACVFWSGQREVKHLQKRVIFNGKNGVCMKRDSVKFNSSTTYGTTCPQFASILR